MHLFLLPYKSLYSNCKWIAFRKHKSQRTKRVGNEKTVTHLGSEKTARPLVTGLADLRKLNPKLAIRKAKK